MVAHVLSNVRVRALDATTISLNKVMISFSAA